MSDTPEPPKPLTLSQLPWTAPWISQVQAKLGTGFSLDPNGRLVVADEVDQDGYNAAAGFLNQTRERSTMVVRATNRMLGELIANYAAKFRVSDVDAIEALGLATSERTVGFLRTLPRIVKRLAADVLDLEGLTHSHFEMATKFAGPTEPDKQREWNLKIRDILFQAAECPEDRPSKWVADSIRAMQKEFGVVSTRPEGGKVLLDQYATINYILEHWTDGQMEEAGQDRRKVLDYRDQIEGELINRNILTIPDPLNFVPPWRLRTQPEAAIDVMEADVVPEHVSAMADAMVDPTIKFQAGSSDTGKTQAMRMAAAKDVTPSDDELPILE